MEKRGFWGFRKTGDSKKPQTTGPVTEKWINEVEKRLSKLECLHENTELFHDGDRYPGVGWKDFYYEECLICGKVLRYFKDKEYYELVIEKSKQRLREVEEGKSESHREKVA